jgi:hypothetical protein
MLTCCSGGGIIMTSIRRHCATLLFGALAAACIASVAWADVVISSDPTQNMTCSAGTCSPTGRAAVLNVTDLANMLASSDVVVTSERRKSPGKMEVIAPLAWASARKLTLEVGYPHIASITIGAPVTVMGQGGFAVIGSLHVTPNASVTFSSLNSVLSINGVSYTLVGDLPTLASDIAVKPNGAFALANDYDAQADVFSKVPIPLLQGQLTGLGHSISNLTVKRGYKLCKGLIATGTSGSGVSDISLHNIQILSDGKSKNVGAVFGLSAGSISRTFVDGIVSGIADANVGGIVGQNGGYVTNAHAAVSVSGGQAGGIAGENSGQISQSSATGAVTGNIDVGGLVGPSYSYVVNSYATGPVTGNNNTGGLAGSNHGTVQYSYAMGAVAGNGGAAGGLIGFNGGSVSQAYATGGVAGGQGYTGGFVGYDPSEGMTYAYWDVETSGISDPHQGAGFPTDDPGIEGLTTAQIQSKLPYGFDKRQWRLRADVNGGFPYLHYNPPQ